LIIGNFAASVSGDQKIDLLAGVFLQIPFFADEVDGAHDCVANGQPIIREMLGQMEPFSARSSAAPNSDFDSDEGGASGVLFFRFDQ
jgi:hypothetical protein